MKEKPILLVDFDGVIHSYVSGWKGVENTVDPIVPGARKFLIDASRVFDVRIWSSRSNNPEGIKAMKKFLTDNNIPLENITFPTEKDKAFLTIDDRAYCFRGKFPDPKNLLQFMPWYQREKGPTRGTCTVCHRDNVKLNPRSIREPRCTFCFRQGYK